MTRKPNHNKGLLHKIFRNHRRQIKREVRLQVKYHIKNNRRSVKLIKRAHEQTETLKHSLLPSLQDKIILDLRKRNIYDSVTNLDIEKYVEAEVRKYFK